MGKGSSNPWMYNAYRNEVQARIKRNKLMLGDFLTILSKKNVPHDSTKNDTNTVLTILNILLLII